jgi:hypothetical protein
LPAALLLLATLLAAALLQQLGGVHSEERGDDKYNDHRAAPERDSRLAPHSAVFHIVRLTMSLPLHDGTLGWCFCEEETRIGNCTQVKRA